MATFFCKTGNTRVIKQSSLQKFQEEMGTVMKDPYKVVMKQSKLPMSLLHDRIQPHVSWRISLAMEFLRHSLCRSLSTIFVFCFSVEKSGFRAVLMSFPLCQGSYLSMNRIVSGRCCTQWIGAQAWESGLIQSLLPPRPRAVVRFVHELSLLWL